jgi:hypothetical protein
MSCRGFSRGLFVVLGYAISKLSISSFLDAIDSKVRGSRLLLIVH